MPLVLSVMANTTKVSATLPLVMKHFGAVEDVVVTLQNGSGLLAGSIGTGVGFGQTESTQLAAGEQVGQILALLLLGAVLKKWARSKERCERKR